MSYLSDFLQKPYPGLGVWGGDLVYVKASSTRFLIDNADTTGTGQYYPELVLRNEFTGGTGGAKIVFEGKNDLPTVIQYAKISGLSATKTVGSEDGWIQVQVLIDGAMSGVSLRGDQTFFGPDAAGTFSCGTATVPFTSVYAGNGTGYLKATADNDYAYVASNGGVIIQPGLVTKVYFAADGRCVFNGGPTDLLVTPHMMQLVGTHTTGTTTGHGFSSQFKIPSNVTNSSAAFHAKLETAAASFTITNIFGVLIGPPIVGAGSTVSNAYGIYVNDLTGSASTSSAAVYYSAAAKASHYGINIVGGVESNFGGKVTFSTANAALSAAAFSNTAATAPSANIVSIATTTSSANAYALLITGADTSWRVGVRADGKVWIGTDGSGWTESGALNLVGRLYVEQNTTFDLDGSTRSKTIFVNGTVTIAASKIAESYTSTTTLTLGNTSTFKSMNSSTTIASAAVSSTVYHHYSYTNVGNASLTSYGLFHELRTGAPGAGSHFGSFMLIDSNGSEGYGFCAQMEGPSGTAGVDVRGESYLTDSVVYGVNIQSSVKVTGAAFSYTQASGSTANFLLYTDSGGSTRFQVNSAGNVVIGGVGRTIKADWSDATYSNRATLQTSVTNGGTSVQVAPNGNGTVAGVLMHSSSAMTNCSVGYAYIDGSAFTLQSIGVGSGTYLPVKVIVGASNLVAVQVLANGDVTVGSGLSGLTATAGHIFVPAVSGTMTGVPTSRSGYVPLCYDATANKIGIYSGGAWKWSTALT